MFAQFLIIHCCFRQYFWTYTMPKWPKHGIHESSTIPWVLNHPWHSTWCIWFFRHCGTFSKYCLGQDSEAHGSVQSKTIPFRIIWTHRSMIFPKHTLSHEGGNAEASQSLPKHPKANTNRNRSHIYDKQPIVVGKTKLFHKRFSENWSSEQQWADKNTVFSSNTSNPRMKDTTFP